MLNLETNHRGDTIVEVLIAMTIIGLVLMVSYVTTNRSSTDERRSQERSEAVQLLQNQIEDLRYTVTNVPGWTPPLNAFCFNSPTSVNTLTLRSPYNPVDYRTNCSITPNGLGTQPEYSLQIEQETGSIPSYTFNATATWYNAGGSGTDTASIAYRIEP